MNFYALTFAMIRALAIYMLFRSLGVLDTYPMHELSAMLHDIEPDVYRNALLIKFNCQLLVAGVLWIFASNIASAIFTVNATAKIVGFRIAAVFLAARALGVLPAYAYFETKVGELYRDRWMEFDGAGEVVFAAAISIVVAAVLFHEALGIKKIGSEP
ncbi:MAG: hypothetical protein IH944_03505 [Armatimonadetes bacterium]|nr:hypothetical protein [Armatimonadota bacterium]